MELHFGEMLVGIGLIAAGSLLWAIARPREGEVRSFLRSESAQAYYSIVVLGLLAAGTVYFFTAVVPGESLSSFKAIR